MICIRTEKEIIKMRAACAVVAKTHDHIAQFIKAGVSTSELDAIAEEFILAQGAKPNFKNYRGYPATACISLNDVVVHGIPSAETVLKEGDIVSIDLGAVLDGYHGDAARTHAVGNVTPRQQRLIDATKQSFFEGLKMIRPNNRIGDISNAIQRHVEMAGFSVVREMIGHGIGKRLHEEPNIPNFGAAGQGPMIKKGHCYAIEPMVNSGGFAIKFDNDGWTCRTKDGSDSAHYENTVLVTENGCEILTVTQDLIGNEIIKNI